MVLSASTLILTAGGKQLARAKVPPAFSQATPWRLHYERVRGIGGAAAAATVDMAFVQAYFEQQGQLGLDILADLCARFGYLLDANGRLIRLFEPQAKDLVLAPGIDGPTLVNYNGHKVMSFNGNNALVALQEQGYDLLSSDLVSYALANPANVNATTSLYAKSVPRNQDMRYGLIYDGGSLYSLYQDDLEHHVATSAPAAGAWRELGQRVQRQAGTNELLVARQAVATQSFAVQADDYDTPYSFALGAYGEQTSLLFFYAGLVDRVRLLRQWPGAAIDTTIWDTLSS